MSHLIVYCVDMCCASYDLYCVLCQSLLCIVNIYSLYCVSLCSVSCEYVVYCACAACCVSLFATVVSALISLGAHSRTIQTVDVGWCEHITAQGAIKISETCPTLQYLGLMRCDLITIAMMELLVERFPRVKFSTMWLDCKRLIQMARSQGFLQNLPSLRM